MKGRKRVLLTPELDSVSWEMELDTFDRGAHCPASWCHFVSNITTNTEALKEHLMFPEMLSDLAQEKPCVTNSAIAAPLNQLPKFPLG